MSTVVVYGVGDFYEKHKSHIEKRFSICGKVDKKYGDGSNTLKEVFPVFGSVNEVDVYYDYLLIMTSLPNIMFEMIDRVKRYGVPTPKVQFGISYWGFLCNYFNFSLCNDYRLNISSRYSSSVVGDYDEFIIAIKKMMDVIIQIEGNKYKTRLSRLYEDKFRVMVLDPRVWRLDHDMDVYFRYEKQGYFNWAHVGVFAMMVLKKYTNPYVLDIGCGDTYFFRHLFRYIKGINYLGCDIDKSTIEYAIRANREDASKCDFMVADIAVEMPEPKIKERFDAIFWLGSYCVFDDDQQKNILKISSERLGKDGILFISDYYSEVKNHVWYYSINSARDEGKLRKLLETYFENVFLYVDKDSESFFLLASNGQLPVNNG